MTELETAVNEEWIRLYGGEPVTGKPLVMRARLIARDRDCWVYNTNAIQKEYLKLDASARQPRRLCQKTKKQKNV